MKETIWQTIASTPWWMFLFSAYFIWVCYNATKPRIVTIRQLTVMPLFIISLSVMSMCAMMKTVSYFHYALWLGMFLLGTGLGYLHFLMLNIKAIKSLNSVYLPGTWAPLFIILSLFISKSYFGYQFTFDPQTLVDPEYAILIILAYGLFTGLFIGRLGYALRCMKSGPFTLLTSASNA
jgi:hypothetical protein